MAADLDEKTALQQAEVNSFLVKFCFDSQLKMNRFSATKVNIIIMCTTWGLYTLKSFKFLPLFSISSYLTYSDLLNNFAIVTVNAYG